MALVAPWPSSAWARPPSRRGQRSTASLERGVPLLCCAGEEHGRGKGGRSSASDGKKGKEKRSQRGKEGVRGLTLPASSAQRWNCHGLYHSCVARRRSTAEGREGGRQRVRGRRGSDPKRSGCARARGRGRRASEALPCLLLALNAGIAMVYLSSPRVRWSLSPSSALCRTEEVGGGGCFSLSVLAEFWAALVRPIRRHLGRG